MMRYVLAVLAYLVPTFVLGYVWHLMLFSAYYHALHIYRDDVIIPFGLASMLIQGSIFALAYDRAFAAGGGSFLSRAATYGALGAALSWTFSTLAVAAKNVMSSVPDYVLIETGYTALQWGMVAPLTVLAFGRTPRTAAA